MFSVHQAASIFYYMGADSAGNHEPVIASGSSEPAGGNYYVSKRQSDPLASTAIWAGKLAAEVGLAGGSEVDLRQLASMWYGYHPDGKTPLDDRGLTIATQAEAQRRVGQAEAELFAARRNMHDIRARLSRQGLSNKAAARKDEVVQQQLKIDEAVAALQAAQASSEYRTCAHDCVFSAPKSVSVFWAALKTEATAGDEGAREAARKAERIEACVLEAARRVCEDVIEPDLVFTRHRDGSAARRYETVRGLAFAMVPHFESRPTVAEATSDPKTYRKWQLPDPQLHVHALLMAMGQDWDDNVRAVWTRFLADNAKGIGAAFRAELASMLRAEGLSIRESTSDKINAFELAGVSDAQIGAFSRRSTAVAKSVAEGKSSQEAVLSTRQAKRDYTSEEMLNDWAVRLDAANIRSSSIAQARAERSNRPKSRDELIKRAVSELLTMTGEIRLRDISQKCYEQAQHVDTEELGGLSAIEWAKALERDIINHRDMKLGNRLDKHGRAVFTSLGLIQRERELYFKAVPELKSKAPAVAIGSDIAAESISKAEGFLAVKKNNPDFLFADFQRRLVESIVCASGTIRVALAPAGCGKTTAALAASMAFESQGMRVIPMAPSNKAAKQLAEDLYKPSQHARTPQSLLASIKGGHFKLASTDVLFVDEASMIDFDVAEALVKAALAADGGPARLVLMGDTEQLPSVGRGNFLRRLVSDNERAAELGVEESIVTRVLETEEEWAKISRQKSNVGKQASAMLALGANAKALAVYESLGAVSLHASRQDAIDEMVSDVFESLATESAALGLAKGPVDVSGALRTFQDGLRAVAMLASTRADVARLNDMARDHLDKLGYYRQAGGRRATLPRGTIGSMEVREGDRIIFTEAIRALTGPADEKLKIEKISKSVTATVLRVEAMANKARLVVELDGGTPRKIATLDMESFSGIDYAYATTIHKAQGATVQRSYELFGSFAAKELDYVAKTRHRELHRIYGAKHEYEAYKKSLEHLTEKVEAMDVGVAGLSAFAPTQEALDLLNGEAAEIEKSLRALGSRQKELRLRHLVQGTLIDAGEADSGDPSQQFATLNIGGEWRTFEGAGLLDRFASAGVKLGDHVGLEAISPEQGSTMSGVSWRWHSKDSLERTGLLIDERSVQAVAEAGRAFRISPSPTLLEQAADQLFEGAGGDLTPANDRAALLAKQARESQIAAAKLISELSSRVNDSIRARELAIPAEALELAFERLEHVDQRLREQIKSALALGIANKAGMEQEDEKTWLAHARGIAFALNSFGELEAWRLVDLEDTRQKEVISRSVNLEVAEALTTDRPLAYPNSVETEADAREANRQRLCRALGTEGNTPHISEFRSDRTSKVRSVDMKVIKATKEALLLEHRGAYYVAEAAIVSSESTRSRLAKRASTGRETLSIAWGKDGTVTAELPYLPG